MDTIELVFHNGSPSTVNELIAETPEELVQRQVNAYNLRNIDAFLDTYSDDVEIYTFPNKLEFKGKERMRSDYGAMFSQAANLHCEIVNRIVDGNRVIDKEHVRFNDKALDGTAIYVIENGKISKVYFLQ
ncbi:nuclear transport factor 2 family protein [Flavobacterium sp. N1718]|uniref:nuclear transport factor 2 family protein n=1 Tax=Flavobacterium sp. N1718 TaxID=2986822 RepID=UPI0022255D09|nr:nuclear transport factor 2 family protein [Flavobacterium sp. N1718]